MPRGRGDPPEWPQCRARPGEPTLGTPPVPKAQANAVWSAGLRLCPRRFTHPAARLLERWALQLCPDQWLLSVPDAVCPGPSLSQAPRLPLDHPGRHPALPSCRRYQLRSDLRSGKESAPGGRRQSSCPACRRLLRCSGPAGRREWGAGDSEPGPAGTCSLRRFAPWWLWPSTLAQQSHSSLLPWSTGLCE